MPGYYLDGATSLSPAFPIRPLLPSPGLISYCCSERRGDLDFHDIMVAHFPVVVTALKKMSWWFVEIEKANSYCPQISNLPTCAYQCHWEKKTAKV